MAEQAARARGTSSWPVRAKVTVITLLVVGAALLAASIGLVTITERVSEDNVRTSARLRAQDFVALLSSGTQPSELHIRLEEDEFVQVLSESGEVLASSPFLEDEATAQLEAGGSTIIDQTPGEDDPFLVVAEGAGSFTVLVGRNLDSVRETTGVITLVLVVSVPLLMLIVGITAWAMVGRALAPVERMRRAVTEISSAELHRRVAPPPGDDEIARLAHTMNDMLGRLEAAQARQRRLVSDASHELRNPVAAIRQHAETALAHPDRTTVPALAGDVLAEDLRLQRLAEDLLLLARADERALGMTVQPVDVDDLVLEEARRLRQTTTLSVDTTGVSAGRVSGDRLQLQRALRNLIDNAFRHAKSAIRIALQEFDGELVLQVDDDGPGVPESQRTLIFRRFTRLDDARDRERGGAGLGLSIVDEIVRAHGGRITVEEAPIGGARFEIRLPARHE